MGIWEVNYFKCKNTHFILEMLCWYFRRAAHLVTLCPRGYSHTLWSYQSLEGKSPYTLLIQRYHSRGSSWHMMVRRGNVIREDVDKRECFWLALLTGQRVGWYKRRKKGKTRSQPTPICINPAFIDLRLCIADAVKSIFSFFSPTPWSLHLLLSLVTQNSEMAQLMKEIMSNKCLLAGFFFFFWCQIGPLTVRLLLKTATPWSKSHAACDFTQEDTSSCCNSPEAMNLPWKGLQLSVHQFRSGRINTKPLGCICTWIHH